MCVPCIVEISGAGRKTSITFIFATLPAVGEAFAFDEPGGVCCEVVVVAIEARQDPFEDGSDCTTLRVRRRKPSRPVSEFDWSPRRRRVRSMSRVA